MSASTNIRSARRAGLTLAGVLAIVLAVAATAWACTADMHDLNVVKANTSSTKSGPAGTAVTASGHCNGSQCPTSGEHQLRQDATPSAGDKRVVDHQVLCDATDPSIGKVTFNSGRVSGSGTIANRELKPATYIICAGDSNNLTAILWDTWTLS